MEYNDYIFELRKAIKEKNADKIKDIALKNNLKLENGALQAPDKAECKEKSKFYDQRQMCSKILLNSLYGSLLNSSSRYYANAMGQSVTLSGRTMTKHMASQINKEITGIYDHEGTAIVYGDSVSGDSLLYVKKDGANTTISIEELFLSSSDANIISSKTHRLTDYKILNYNPETGESYYGDVEFIIQHETVKELFEIQGADGSVVTVTEDHSVMVEIEGILTEKSPLEISELLDQNIEVTIIKAIL